MQTPQLAYGISAHRRCTETQIPRTSPTPCSCHGSRAALRQVTWSQEASILFFFFSFLGPHQWHMEVPRLGVESELQLPAYTTAIATRDLSHIYNLHLSSQQRQILNAPNEARDQTSILMDASQAR